MGELLYYTINIRMEGNMKLSELFTVTEDKGRWSLSESEEPLCEQDFYDKYRNKPEWEKEIMHIRVMTRRAEQELNDEVIFLIILK